MAAFKKIFNNLCHSASTIHKASRFMTAGTNKIIVDKDPDTGVATIYMNNAPVNQLDGEMLQRCTEAIKSVEADNDVRGIIITSSFDGKVFSAGLRLNDLYKKSHDDIAKYWRKAQDWHLSYFGCKKPVVACINGHSPAGGCTLALMCDYRVMQGGAKKTIGMIEAQVGIAPTYSGTDLMVRTIGVRKAEDAILKAKLFSAEEALDAGLVDEIGDLGDIKGMAKRALLEFIPISGFSETKLIARQVHIDRLTKVRFEEAEAFADRICQPHTQQCIGDYLSRLGGKK